jgi:rubrerythrin
MDEVAEKRLPGAEDLHAMTEASLKAAFAGESQAAEKYMVFAEQADEEGYPNIANLFRAISFAETRHARNHLRVMGGVGTTAENLKAAFEGESFEIDEMYPAYAEIARMQAMTQASRSIRYAQRSEADHKEMYAAARAKAMAGADIEAGPVSVCVICGHTVIGDLPEKCLVCGAPKEYYKTF